MRFPALTTFLSRLRPLRSEVAVVDAVLLRRFLADHDEAAFTELVRRHGPMVLGVCRRVLRHEQDAEEAFQATFLLLACKGGWIAPRQQVGAWLHGVAWRAASQARRTARRRGAHERLAAERPAALAHPPELGELAGVLDEEVARLPDRYRAPVVLCLLEGRTLREAAGILGWPEGSVSGRLTRARRILARRLERRGFAPAGHAALALVPPTALPAVRAVDVVLLSAARLAGPEGLVGVRVVTLMDGVWQVMWRTMMQKLIAVVLLVGLVGTGLVLGVAPGPDEGKPPALAAKRAKAAEPAPADKPAAGDRLPAGVPPTQVLARLQDKELIVTIRVNYYEPRTVQLPDGTERTGYYLVRKVEERKYDLAKVRIHDTRGKEIGKVELARLLRKDRPAVASLDGQPVDSLHLRILKEDVPVLILPAPVAVPPVDPPPAAPPAMPSTPAPPAAPPGVIMPPATPPPAAPSAPPSPPPAPPKP
jgi:RNA polymerase sigma factor (sigma-70 family)